MQVVHQADTVHQSAGVKLHPKQNPFKCIDIIAWVQRVHSMYVLFGAGKITTQSV